mmetsp:Transcript_5181/g.10308  ORF Transcript_5181/g.10308 Transcript_5181/m.10308 type:complete len:89 (-) Transcript_5181:309-575(-)
MQVLKYVVWEFGDDGDGGIRCTTPADIRGLRKSRLGRFAVWLDWTGMPSCSRLNSTSSGVLSLRDGRKGLALDQFLVTGGIIEEEWGD